jgi:hypothetical protein
MLEFQASLHAIAFPPNHNVGGHEANDLKILAKLVCVPDLAVLGFEGFPAARFGVDLDKTFATYGFGWIGHKCLLLLDAFAFTIQGCFIIRNRSPRN